MIDVLVAGGGPAGLAAAICCARLGLSVTVAEPRPVPIDKACGEGLMPAAVQRLARIGVHPDGHVIRGIRYTDATRSADAPFRGGTGLGVRRTTLHEALAQRAASAGVEIVGARVAGFTQEAKTVRAILKPNGPGAPAALPARFLIGADGLHSPVRKAAGLAPAPARHGLRGARRYGLRRHYRAAPWTDLVEVHWSRDCEAYVTPVADDVVGVAVLGERGAGDPGAGERGTDESGAGGRGAGESGAGGRGVREPGGGRGAGNLDARLALFPELLARLRDAGATRLTEDRGAGPLRQAVRRRVAGRVLLVGDAAGYTDALTGEGIGAALAQAQVLAECLAAGRPEGYERAWRRVTRKERALTAGLLWSRNQPLLAPRIVPAAAALPALYTAIVNQVAWA